MDSDLRVKRLTYCDSGDKNRLFARFQDQWLGTASRDVVNTAQWAMKYGFTAVSVTPILSVWWCINDHHAAIAFVNGARYEF